MYAIFKRILVILSVTAAVVVSALLAAPTASAREFTRGAVTVNCSWGSCSYYVSRSATRELNSRIAELQGGGALTAATACGVAGSVLATPAVGVPAGLICGGAAGVDGFRIADSIKQAADRSEHPPNGACFKATFPHGPQGVLYHWYSTNNGRFCRN